jgi:hypothetical protein
MFKNLFRPVFLPAAPSLDVEIRAAAHRCVARLRDNQLDPTQVIASVESFIERAIAEGTSAPPPELLSDLAALLGEHVRPTAGGVWAEDPLYGLSLVGVGSIPHAVLGPYQIVRKKWQLGPRLSLQSLFANLPRHLLQVPREERTPLPPPETLSVEDDAEVSFAKEQALQARTRIAAQIGNDVPLTLVGLRSAERWLRSHFLVRTAPLDDFHRLGFLLGEVMRGLYGGRWDFADARRTGDWAHAALVFPELPFLPLGRILKMLLEQPEGNGLDEYVRLVPAARTDMRRDRAALSGESP